MILLLVGLAAAQEVPEGETAVTPVPIAVPDPTTWTGKIVAQVTLSEPDGGLPEESLEPLLQTRPDEPYSPSAIRQDIVTLYRIGDFSQVEAVAEPWIAYGPDGEPVEGVRVEFRVYAPPRVGDIDISGNKGLRRHEILAAMGVDAGASWSGDSSAATEVAIRSAYLAAGYPQARVEIETVTPQPGHVDLRVKVEEGAPRTLVTIAAPPQKALTTAQVTAILRRSGIHEGKPLAEATLTTARDALLKALRDRGW